MSFIKKSIFGTFRDPWHKDKISNCHIINKTQQSRVHPVHTQKNILDENEIRLGKPKN